jgi:hypothetical protein
VNQDRKPTKRKTGLADIAQLDRIDLRAINDSDALDLKKKMTGLEKQYKQAVKR